MRISIHAPHARSDPCQISQFTDRCISIHAPHARSDKASARVFCVSLYFNPRSSCEERRRFSVAGLAVMTFQSTLLMRGATCGGFRRSRIYQFQSTLLMRGATDHPPLVVDRDNFNPRSSCEERPINIDVWAGAQQFQSTLLMRGATTCWTCVTQ